MKDKLEIYKKEVERLKDLVSTLEKDKLELKRKLSSALNGVEHYKEKWLEK